MKLTTKVRKILDNYASESVGTKTNLARILMTGKLAGTGKMIILPVDQGFEHGPARSFAVNEPAYDPSYHHKLAIDAGLNAYAAPLGMLEESAERFAGSVPLILKINSNNSLNRRSEGRDYDQAVTANIQDALRLGCSAIGFTTYPGSDENLSLLEELRELTLEAKACGLAVVTWAYVRGGDVTKDAETSIDGVAYGAHMACLMGANIVKVKLPSDYLGQAEAKKVFEKHNISISTQKDRVEHVVKSCFDGKRMVVFSGGSTKGADAVYQDARDVRDGGGNGLIIGRNSFQRPRDEALDMLNNITRILKGQD